MHEMPKTWPGEAKMNLQEVFRFMDSERLGVLTTATNSGRPEAALMGFAVTPALEIIFDTVAPAGSGPH
jgi:hypothetical protein